MLLNIATGLSRNDTRWHNENVSWEWLVQRCGQPDRSPESFAEYMAGTPDFKQSKKDVGGMVSGFIDGGRRLKTAVLSKQIVTLDVDYAKPDFLEVLKARLGSITYLYYSTHSHSAEAGRYRLFIPLDKPAVPAQYEAIARYIAGYLGIDQFDRTCYDLNRLMFWPSASRDGVFEAGHNSGPWASVDGILSQYVNYLDISSWPVGDGEIVQLRRDADKLENPTLKSGTIGAFCKLYTTHEFIRNFLPDRYLPSDEPNRYSYKHGSTSKGLWVIDDHFVYSFHNTDPAGQQVSNVFDLLRLHLFGGAEDNPDQAMGNRKSFKAASEYVRGLPAVRKALAIEKYSPYEIFGVAEPVTGQPQAPLQFNAAPPQPLGNSRIEYVQSGPAVSMQPPVANIAAAYQVPLEMLQGHQQVPLTPPPANGAVNGHVATAALPAGMETASPVAGTDGLEWLGKLEMDSKGVNKNTIGNVVLILENDPRVQGMIAKDIFRNQYALRGMVPWILPGRTNQWTDTDDQHLLLFFEDNYDIMSKEKILCGLEIVASKRGYHPVKEYLQSVRWDGTARIEQLFHYFLGAEDNLYTRQVSRKWFTAAVARIYEPGIKFDNMLVFVGKAGLGKSWLIDKLAGAWFSDTSVDLRNKKEAMEEMQGVWIMEWGELTSFRTSSIEAVKAFVSKRSDNFRAAYDRRMQDHARQCIFVGTTNKPEFLSDPDGNRRFWPVHVNQVTPQRSVGKDFTKELRDQLWAEACYMYAQGEPLILDEQVAELAEYVQQSHMETDEREQLIGLYLEKPMPVNWYSMNSGERAAFLQLGGFQNMESPLTGETMRRDKVCAMEIWFEVFEGGKKEMTKLNTRLIHDIMRSMKGWEMAKNPLHVGIYGKQKCYVRKGINVLAGN